MRLATGNAHKLSEVRAILAPLGFAVRGTEDLGGLSVVEDGATFAENAVKKARALLERTGEPSIADDSGICVDALGGAPGLHSARWAGVEHGPEQDEANRRRLLAELEGVAEPRRTARYVCAIAYCAPGEAPRTFEGVFEGRIVEAPRGDGGFGYDPLFVPSGYAQTVAELDPALKNRISHRALALLRLVEFLRRSG